MAKTTAQVEAAAGDIPKESMCLFSMDMVACTWDLAAYLEALGERKRNQKEIRRRCSRKLAQVTGAEILAFGPPSLPGSTADSAAIRDPHHRRLSSARGCHGRNRDSGARKRPVSLRQQRSQFDMRKLISRSMRTKQTASALACRILALRSPHCSRQLCQPFQPKQPQLSSHPAGAEGFPPHAGLADPLSAAHQIRRLGSLATVASLSTTVQPNGLPTFQQLNAATLQGVPFPGHTLGEAIGFLQQKQRSFYRRL